MGEDEEFGRRKDLTFLQAEGLEALPQQLKRGEISKEFRAKLLELLHLYLKGYSQRLSTGGSNFAFPSAVNLFRSEWVNRRNRFVDEFPSSNEVLSREIIFQDIKKIIANNKPEEIFDFVQFILREKALDSNIRGSIKDLFSECYMAYRVFGAPPTLIPVSSDADAKAIITSLSTLRKAKQKGASTHLENAVENLNSGNFSDSVRESIHAVESTVRKVTGKDKGKDNFTRDLKLIAKETYLHPAMENAFNALYGYTSDENGIRHALLDDKANVDEHTALFMYSTCASFCAYLVNVTRK